ncbi:hypothetical protein Droror1_Dr00028052 [Drosera rotundifolia]
MLQVLENLEGTQCQILRQRRNGAEEETRAAGFKGSVAKEERREVKGNGVKDAVRVKGRAREVRQPVKGEEGRRLGIEEKGGRERGERLGTEEKR